MNKEHRCKACKETLDISVSAARKYCEVCQRTRVKKRAVLYYHKVLKPRRRLSIHKCIICETEFVFSRKTTDFLKVCNSCIVRFKERVSNMTCTFCGKIIPKKKSKAVLRLFCNKDCSVQAWYILKKSKQKKQVKNE